MDVLGKGDFHEKDIRTYGPSLCVRNQYGSNNDHLSDCHQLESTIG
jgi:hypothetical protein